MNCLHPVRLLTRTDADINTLYHSFFLIQYLPSTKELKTIKKISNSKSDINNIESGLGIFVIDIVKNSTETERSGICVVTTSSGIRYYAFLRSYKNKVFAAVACLPIISFTRRLLDLLVFEEKDVLTNMLLVLCELPVVPVAGLQYKIELTAGVAELKFSAIEQAEDSDIDILIISVLTPKMIVRAWEAIVLERKVLVVSSIDSIITACCEFFRRLALPLFIVNTYVPLLPEQLIESVEAPFPYLLGANTNIIRKAGVDLSDTVIIDLDNRDVIPVRNSTSFPADSRAPTNLIAKLMIEVNEILLKPLGNWLQRADSSQPYNSCEKVGTVNSPICEESFKLRATMISQLFIRTNLSLISSRTCTVRAFFRRPKVEGTINEDFSDLNLQQNPKRKACTSMGYHFSGGIHSGFMQLVKERNEDDDAGPNFIPCWVEMDSRIFSVYEHADSLPVIYVMNREIDSVSPSPLEPEGHVFELVLKDQSSYRFTTTDSDSRRAWISIIEKTQRSNSQENGFAASNGASPPLKEPSAVETISPSHIRSNSVNPTHMNGELHKSQASSPAPSVGGDETDTDSLRIGLPIAAEDSRSLDIESYEDSIFRYYIMKTQMMSSLKSHLESQEYDTLARENDITLSELIMNKFDKRFLKYVRKSGPILSILEQLKNEDIEDIDKIPIPVFDDDDDSDLDFLRHSETRLSHQDEIKRDYSPNFPRALSTSAAITSSNAVLMNNGNAVSPPTGTNFASEKNRRGSSLLGGFFSRRSSDNKELEQQFQDQLREKHELEKQREREIKENMRQFRKKLFSVASSYLECQAELAKTIVSGRMTVLASLIGVLGSKGTSDMEYDPSGFNITIPLKDIITRATKDASSEHADELSSTITEGIAINGSYKHREVRSESTEKSIARSGSFTKSFLLDRKSHVDLTFKPSTRPSFSVRLGFNTDDEDSKYWHNSMWSALDGKEIDESNVAVELSAAACLTAHSESNEGNNDLLDGITAFAEFDSDGQSEVSCDTENIDSSNMEAIRQALLDQINEQISSLNKDNNGHLLPVFKAMAGCIYYNLGETSKALQCYAVGSLVSSRRIMSCILMELKGWKTRGELENCCHELSFLRWCYDTNPIIGLQAFRLFSEALYKQLIETEVDLDTKSKLNPIALKNYPTTPRNFPIKMYSNTNVAPNALATGMHSADFTWTGTDIKSDVLNENVKCIALGSNSAPCELSLHLLSRLREILRSYCLSANGSKLSKKLPSGTVRLKVNSTMTQDVMASSAFRAFELQCCQLQQVDLTEMSYNERLMFFLNVYNTITVHALIVKGSPGNNILERTAFLRSSKYNIAGMILNLFEIEHGILRHSSTKPMLFGPLTISVTFSDRDPRRLYVLEKPCPNVTFGLFCASLSSPALSVIKDLNTVHEELMRCARRFILEHVRLDPLQKSIELPGLLKVYWADFGGSRMKVLKTIAQLGGSQFAAELKPYMSMREGNKPKVEFTNLDWTPIISL